MSANKENQESEQAELQSVASPRISSTGAGGSEDAAGTARAPGPAARQRVPQGYDHHDWVHWGGVGQRVPHDARSVASSAAADRDDKSIFEEPGALDAHSEGEGEGAGLLPQGAAASGAGDAGPQVVLKLSFQAVAGPGHFKAMQAASYG